MGANYLITNTYIHKQMNKQTHEWKDRQPRLSQCKSEGHTSVLYPFPSRHESEEPVAHQ